MIKGKETWDDSDKTGSDILNDIERAKHIIKNQTGYKPPNPFLDNAVNILKRLLTHERSRIQIELFHFAYEKATQEIIEELGLNE